MPRHITPAQLKTALDKSGVKATYEKGWDDPVIDPYREKFTPVGVVLHHTAGISSLAFCMRGSFPPVRNCHFLIDRDGTIHVLAGSGCYHAGEGGPRTVNGVNVPKDLGNRFFYGIEIESLGRKGHVDATSKDRDGMTPAQVEATSRLTAALCLLVGGDETAVLRHKDWAPLRKVDVQQPLEFWRDQVKARLEQMKPTPVIPGPSIDAIKAAEANPKTRNEASRVLAVRLHELGYYTTPLRPATKADYPRIAVTNAQKALGLPVGPYTLTLHQRLFGGAS